MAYNANGLTKEQETRINKQIIHLKTWRDSGLITTTDAQYQLLKYLQRMELPELQIRNIFGNTTI